jgi:hypothetical protein
VILCYETETTPSICSFSLFLLFLCFQLAAQRYAKYWTKRVEIFGNNAFAALTQKKALKEDAIALEMGFAKLVGTKDSSGRSIILIDPSCQDLSKYTRESMTRSCWYMIHAALEDETTQKRGIIFMIYPHNSKLGQFDRAQSKMNAESIQGCLPVRVSGFHICYPPTFFAIVIPIFKIFLGNRLRKRIRVHSGSEQNVLKALEQFGLTKDVLPSDLGGNIVLDHEQWLADRLAEDSF